MRDMKQWVVLTAVGLAAASLIGCATVSGGKGTVTKAPFGNLPDGTPIDIYTLRNGRGMEARICTYGGIVVSLTAPDRNGRFADIVLGYDNLDGYVKNNPYFGSLVGRYGNRIAKGKFTLDGTTYALATNDKENHLHGGLKGFDKVVWKARQVKSSLGPAVEFSYVSKDGEEGYPGTLAVKAIYTLTSDNSLRLDFTATTDKPTVCNLTHHSYFNLAGKGDILGHEVMMVSDRFTPVDSGLIPTGELKPVDGTPFDFRTPITIGARINNEDEQLKLGLGYDHNWVISKPMRQLGLQARVYEPTTGRLMEVLSTEPGLQFYSGNFLDGTITGKGGRVYAHRNGFCMEPQHYPDSPNKPNFPSVVLRPGEMYKNTILYKFSAK